MENDYTYGCDLTDEEIQEHERLLKAERAKEKEKERKRKSKAFHFTGGMG